jgi:hypothetical protein
MNANGRENEESNRTALNSGGFLVREVSRVSRSNHPAHPHHHPWSDFKIAFLTGFAFNRCQRLTGAEMDEGAGDDFTIFIALNPLPISRVTFD